MSWHAVGTYRVFDGRGGGRQVRNPSITPSRSLLSIAHKSNSVIGSAKIRPPQLLAR
jgi:hypothetical protein